MTLKEVQESFGSRCWLKPKKRRRFHFNFAPTSSSWLNQVERWFAEISRKPIRRGSFNSVQELEKAIYEYLAASNEARKPFVWKTTADTIVKKVKGCKGLIDHLTLAGAAFWIFSALRVGVILSIGNVALNSRF